MTLTDDASVGVSTAGSTVTDDRWQAEANLGGISPSDLLAGDLELVEDQGNVISELLTGCGDPQFPMNVIANKEGGIKIVFQALDGHGDRRLTDPKMLGYLGEIFIFNQLLIVF